MIITGDSEHFDYFNFDTSFLKNENLFWKAEVPFLVERTTIGNATFL